MADDPFVTESDGNVYLDLGSSGQQQEAAALQLRSDFMRLLRNHIEENGMTQGEAAKLFEVTQPRVSDLVRDKAELFSLETLMSMAVKAGAEIRIEVKGLLPAEAFDAQAKPSA